MTEAASASVGLALSPETFAKLSPGPVLLAHLKSNTRRSGRRPDEFRTPAINKGSLTHVNGSAVVRIGNTAVVCGVRAELLHASDMPKPPRHGQNQDEDDLVEELGLIVPNVELSTGCSPGHLPGNPPGSQAQSLTYRAHTLLGGVLRLHDLQIEYELPANEDEDSGAEPTKAIKGYWTLYVDVYCMALDGNAVDAISLAVVSALQDTTLPKAWWDADRETIVCSPLAAQGRRLQLKVLPLTTTFAIFSTASPLKQKNSAQSWMLADPDNFEEDCCEETVTVALNYDTSSGSIRSSCLQKQGGAFVNKQIMRQCIEASEARCALLLTLLKESN
jgi:exosome complex component RRP43